jgi:hypothetical protein
MVQHHFPACGQALTWILGPQLISSTPIKMGIRLSSAGLPSASPTAVWHIGEVEKRKGHATYTPTQESKWQPCRTTTVIE